MPFAWIARLHGSKVVYVESLTRIERPSLSCRLIAPVASRIYAQWPELAQAMPRARFVGSVLELDMILVTTGSSGGSFDRLLAVVERFGVDEEVVVQHGPSALRPEGARCVAYVPFDELSRLVSGRGSWCLTQASDRSSSASPTVVRRSSSRVFVASARSSTTTSSSLRDGWRRLEQ